MSARLPRKRARTDADEEPEEVKPDPSNPVASGPADVVSGSGPASQLKKDEEFWFEDGTVILHAGYIEFRVYGGLLEGHSTVFKELFAQTHPVRTVSIAGRHDFPCPVVKLSDSPYDLRYVLRSCMPKQAGSLYDTEITPSFDMVSAAIRLGQKYKIIDMSQKALGFLKGHYTDSLDTWNEIDIWSPSDWKDVKAMGVVNLARLTGELSLLPVALMVCIVRVDGDIVHGFTHEDGSQEHLTLDDLRLCFKAKTRLREANIAALFRSLAPTPASTCKVNSQCSKALRNAFRGDHIEAQVDVLMYSDVLLHTAANYLKNKDEKHILCQACVSMVDERDRRENQALWGRLPELLGIEVPGWGKSAAAPAPPSAPAFPQGAAAAT